jgi:hypothetical protein
MQAKPTSPVVFPLPCTVGHKLTLEIPHSHVPNVTSPVARTSLVLIMAAIVCAGRRLTFDHVDIGREVNDSTGFDKESMNRSPKIIVPTMGPHTKFKQ